MTKKKAKKKTAGRRLQPMVLTQEARDRWAREDDRAERLVVAWEKFSAAVERLASCAEADSAR